MWVKHHDLAGPVIEHLKNASNFKVDSFIIQHWHQLHAASNAQSKFKFKILKSCTDTLTRQVGEAIWILSTGNLNSKTELGLNHLCRMISDKTPWETEKEIKEAELEKKKEAGTTIVYCSHEK